ncbi:hypothetical protein K8Z61_17755 [Nocardioides sp. TRM66260-LWL]|uniref:hypothetical protein n=1 Tax=Nocardioides sp. TRM66260-LWL TaxID=2874478 RepID=UPI001CC453B2|nr:hypothetical protein [Nocardioides sp. TRM66260-LWL]MBZ5736340.1 hypothetical protein [Nocardioides sp. TRM66260-LWL]
MSEPTPRVRVTGPPRRRTPLARPAGSDPRDDDLDALYVRALLRDQLALAARTLGTLALVLGALPALFWRWPGLADHRLLGVPLAWLLLGVAAYPLLVLLGWRHVRRAERAEDAFADLCEGRGEPRP